MKYWDVLNELQTSSSNGMKWGEKYSPGEWDCEPGVRMDEEPGSLGSVIIGERIIADTPLRCPHSMFSCGSIAAPRSPLLPSYNSKLGLVNLRALKISASNQFTMARARSSSIFLVALLVVSCFCVAQGAISGTILSRTLLQVSPGAGTAVLTTLTPRTAVSVMCRTQSEVVFDDPWWLKVSVLSTGMIGYVADYYVDCGDVGNCNVVQCLFL